MMENEEASLYRREDDFDDFEVKILNSVTRVIYFKSNYFAFKCWTNTVFIPNLSVFKIYLTCVTVMYCILFLLFTIVIL